MSTPPALPRSPATCTAAQPAESAGTLISAARKGRSWRAPRPDPLTSAIRTLHNVRQEMSPLGGRTQFKADLSAACWPWPMTSSRGYAYCNYDGTQWAAHRLMWTLLRGPIPPKMTIDHLCRNRACVNPWHMEVVTRSENVLRGESQGARAHRTGLCLRGHPLDRINQRTGWRSCSVCARLREQRKKERVA
jgi:HNH endonuclease